MVSASFGWECKRDRIGIGVVVGGQVPPICEKCGLPMTPAEGADAPGTMMNVHCRHCGYTAGMVITVGGQDDCPECGKPFD